MNGLKIRKLMAVVAGGALLGAAVAPMVSAITSAEAKSVVYSADMSPVVNIVVGQNAAVSDGVWAGNIARKVVEKSVKSMTYTGGGSGGSGSAVVTDLAAVLSLGGTITTTGGKVFDNTPLNSTGTTAEYQQDIGKDPLAFLTDKSISYKYNGSNTSIDVKETIGVKLNPRFDTATSVKDLDTRMDSGDINYVVNLGSGIPTVATANVGGSTGDFVDGSDDNIRIPFFGKTFLVQKIDIDDSNNIVELRLVEDKAKQTFVAGESFTVQGIGQYDGQTLTVTVVSIVATGPATTSYQAKFNLTDTAGNVIDTQTLASGNFVEFEDSAGDDVVSGDIYLDSASVNTGTNEGSVDVLVGTSSVRLLDGQNYPYNESVDAENISGPYQVTLQEVASTNRLTKIIIKNSTKATNPPNTAAGNLVKGWPVSVFSQDYPLYSSDDSLTAAGMAGIHEFSFLNGTGALGEDFFKIRFDGFKEDQALVYVQIGDNELEFKDAQDTTHRIPFWMRLPEAGDSGSGQAGTRANSPGTFNANSNGIQFTFDNKTMYYDVNQSSQDFNIANGTILNGVAVNIEPLALSLTTDLGIIDVNTAEPTNVVINGVSYATVSPATNYTQVTLRADGWVRFAKASLNDSTASSDFINGASATNVIVASGGMTTAQLANVFFYDDANIMSSGYLGGIGYGPRLTLSGDNYAAAYGFFVNETGSNMNGRGASEGVYLSLLGNTLNSNTTGTGQAIPVSGGLQKSKNMAFFGTDRGEDGTVDTNFYVPQIDNYGQNPSAEVVLSAHFGVDENNGTALGYNTRVYIDTRDDQIPVLGGSSNKISNPTSDVNYGGVVGAPALNGQVLSLTTDTSSSSALTQVYTDWGTKISIADGQTAEFWIPDARPNMSYTVSGVSTTSEVIGGEELTVKEGETGTFTTGTTITVKDITYTATVGDATVVTNGAPFTYMSPAPLNGKAMVYTTGASVPGPKIIVGGPLVNSLATEVASALNTAGDKVSGVYTGNIIVAGYTAEDTGAAAQDLIAALDAM